jgi:molecular chaperone HscB
VALQHNLGKNYFEIMGLPESFTVDLVDLSSRYHQLQQSVHPDRFVDATEHEKRLSLQWATQINAAHDTLKAGLSRAIYLLELHGVDIEHNPKIAPDFLMEQIELREHLEDIADADDSASLELLDAFKASVSARIGSLEADFAAQFDADLPAAETTVYKLQFINKLLNEAVNLEEKLLDY